MTALRRNPENVVAVARSRFAAGQRRAAWDSLGVMARRHPGVLLYREALSDLYRRAGSPDQAARWGAHDPDALDDRERRALLRSLRQFATEAQVRAYLVLPKHVLPELALELPSREDRRRARGERIAAPFETASAVVGAVLGGGVALLGLVIVAVLAFTGDPDVQTAAQLFAWMVLILGTLTAALALTASVARRRWGRVVLLALAIGSAAIALAQADPTSPVLFGH